MTDEEEYRRKVLGEFPSAPGKRSPAPEGSDDLAQGHDPGRHVRAAAAAAASIPAPDDPALVPIPAPRTLGKRQLVCPARGCNHRFTSLARYDLHWRIKHGGLGR